MFFIAFEVLALFTSVIVGEVDLQAPPFESALVNHVLSLRTKSLYASVSIRVFWTFLQYRYRTVYKTKLPWYPLRPYSNANLWGHGSFWLPLLCILVRIQVLQLAYQPLLWIEGQLGDLESILLPLTLVMGLWKCVLCVQIGRVVLVACKGWQSGASAIGPSTSGRFIGGICQKMMYILQTKWQDSVLHQTKRELEGS